MYSIVCVCRNCELRATVANFERQATYASVLFGLNHTTALVLSELNALGDGDTHEGAMENRASAAHPPVYRLDHLTPKPTVGKSNVSWHIRSSL